VQQPLQPFDDAEDRSLLENGGIKEAKQQRDLDQLPQKTGRAVRVPVVFTLRLCVLTTAYSCRVSHRLAPLAAPAPAADPRQGHRVCPVRLRYLSCGGRLAAHGRQAMDLAR